MGRYALLVATGEYADVRLSRLRAPSQDVERLAALLEDPGVGGFAGVRVLRDAADHEIRRAVEDVLAARTPDDLVLLYFSCHGLTTAARRLYFAAANTVQDRPAGTAIPRSFLNEQLEDCRASGRVLMLDCCFSGAYVEGFKDASSAVLDGGGEGYVVLTASNAYEYAFEEDTVSLEAPRASLFTDVVIEGLSSGAADLDGDGWVDVNELFSYAFREVRGRRPDQTPQFFAQSAGPPLRIARAGGAVPSVVRRSASYTSGQLLVARGFRAAAEPVCRTLGPWGRRSVVLVDGRPVELADSAAIASAFQPDDPRDSLGASYVRELISEVHATCGDGGASAVAVARGAITRLVEAMRDGHDPVRLLHGVRAAADAADRLIRSVAEPLERGDVARLAAASAASDRIGAVVGEVVAVTGRFGAVLVEPGLRAGVDHEVVPGLRLESGYVTALCVTDPVRREAVLADARVLLFAGRLPDRALALVDLMGRGSPLLVVCAEVPESVLGALLRSDRPVVVVCAEVTERLSAVVGGEVLDDDLLYRADAHSLGHAAKVVVTEWDTTVIGSARPSAGDAGQDVAGVIRAPADALARTERAVRAVRSAARDGVLRGAGVGLGEIGARLADEAPVAGGPVAPAGLTRLAGSAGAAGSAGQADPAVAGPVGSGPVGSGSVGSGSVAAARVAAEAAGWRALAGALGEPARCIAENSAVEPHDLDPALIDSAGTARAVVAAAARTAARFLLVA
ncbi:caspase, EACC1-associated type [Saccharothrix australiensis]|uniref:Chaperonin GroEL n=1 Tax=Saccharothrix australiensis TaxID=2072 RepID=A0A495VRA1_9PSEU|nr:TCP-1/cpn60 chaperonin family protein [Saccharothrix australiensis]RKT51949.1 chaperonin GroEL [Saccharothrix australiensis]